MSLKFYARREGIAVVCQARFMYDIADRLLAAAATGAPIVVATAIAVDGSAPRTVGASMAFDGTTVIGSIAGGCVEGAVIEVAQRVLETGASETVDFGVDDESAMAVGLSCGGAVRVHVQLFSAELAAALAAGAQVEVCREFTQRRPVQRHLIVLGALEFSAALAAAAVVIGFRVTVCDPRSLFATAERFPGCRVVVEWPPEFLAREPLDANTVVCVLSHDWRFDADVLAIALRSEAAFVGAMGSRVTHERRIAALEQRGVDPSRLHSPIGLDLGASTPEETAISILAEVLAAHSGSSAASLRDGSGSIHA